MIKKYFFFLVTWLLTLPCYADTPSEDKKLNIYAWSGNIDPQILKIFTAETGIIIHYDIYDSDEVLEAKLLTGKSGYDLVSPSLSPFFIRQAQIGLYMPLNKDLLPNWKNLDEDILKLIGEIDPGHKYGMPYMWGTSGFGYNVEKMQELFPEGAPLDSLQMLFDEKIISKASECGVSFLDSAQDVLVPAFMYLGIPADNIEGDNLKQVVSLMKTITSYVQHFTASSESIVNNLVTGNTCLVQGWSGEILRAREEAKASGKPFHIAYTLPKEGTFIWMDMLVIPTDAPHPLNAHAFLNFLMRPEIAAQNTKYILQASANKLADQYLPAEIKNDPLIYPPKKTFKNFKIHHILPLSTERQRTRAWTHIKVDR
jgi:putrescine transport system substrate-binding protein